MILALPLLSLLLATTGFAAPHQKRLNVPGSALWVPSNQTQLVVPNTALSYLAMGVGNQNYSCTDSGNYTSVGTVAQMYDISRFYGTPAFHLIQDDVFKIWLDYPSNNPYDLELAAILSSELDIDVIGQYYFIGNSNGTLSPKWDFTSSGPTKGNAEAFVVATKVGDIPAPTGPTDIDWVELKGVEGELANTIFRVFTHAGQPPSSCAPGSPVITVKYTAQYFFFGGSLST